MTTLEANPATENPQRAGRGISGARKTILATCQHCETEFTPMKGAVGTYCTQSCMNESRRNSRQDWFPCSKCMASIGIGMTVAARLLHTNKRALHRAWKREGVKAQVPECGDWRRYAQKAGVFTYTERVWWGANGADWMRGYNPRFFDWSCLASHEIAKKRGREYQSMMHRTSPKQSNFRLKKIARSRIYNAIKRMGKGKPRLRYRTEKMIGCTIEQLCKHIESKFKRGMTWENHGTRWHIDHIIPMAHFDLIEESQLLASCHYTNMQPMWAEDNLAKSDKLERDTQMHLRICATH